MLKTDVYENKYYRQKVATNSKNIVTGIGHLYSSKTKSVDLFSEVKGNFICYCVKGVALLVINGLQYKISEGTFLLVDSDTKVKLQTNANSPISLYYINFKKQEITITNSKINIDEHIIGKFKNSTSMNLFYMIFLSLISTADCQCSEFLNFNDKSLLYLLEIVLKDRITSQTLVSNLGIILKFDYYVESNLEQKIELQDIMNALDISKNKLYEIVASQYNDTPIKHIQKVKIKHAEYMLANTTLKVKTISRNLGFNNQYHFSKVFKQEKNISPSCYREKYLK